MEIQVQVERILEPQSFQKGDGSPIIRNSFVAKTQANYPKTMKFDVINQERWVKMNIQVGGVYMVSFDAESREWHEKWFTSLSCWKAIAISGVTQQALSQPQVVQAPTNAPQQPVQNDSNQDLPF